MINYCYEFEFLPNSRNGCQNREIKFPALKQDFKGKALRKSKTDSFM